MIDRISLVGGRGDYRLVPRARVSLLTFNNTADGGGGRRVDRKRVTIPQKTLIIKPRPTII